MQGVWASKYNERALLSMKKVGLNFNDLRMAVLVQRVIPAEYAYVIHTHNPSNGSAEEIYAEVVKGLGESIVSGMVPGSSLAFMARKDALDSPQVRSPCWITLLYCRLEAQSSGLVKCHTLACSLLTELRRSYARLLES